MSRVSLFSSPYLVGFDELERLLDRTSKAAGDAYPPYNIESLKTDADGTENFRITLAVAGFSESDLEITIEKRQLIVRGKQENEEDKTYLHRGIAARQFQRAFVLAEGMEVKGAELENGMLYVSLIRKNPEPEIKRIKIKSKP